MSDMIWLFIAVTVVVLVLLWPAQQRWEAERRRTLRARAEAEASDDEHHRRIGPPLDETPYEMMQRDPVQALQRYGGEGDVERLIAEGREAELRGLGWEPKDENRYEG